MEEQHPPLQAKPKPHSRRRQPPISHESRFVGYLVLGFGVLAVIAVLILAFSSGGPRIGQETPAPEKVDGLMAELNPAPAIVQPVPPKPKEPAFEREKGVAPEKITGAWQAMIGAYTAVAQLDGKVYQIILAPTDPLAPRVYSSGTYTITRDLLTLTPQLSWPSPDPGAGKDVTYSMLTRADFSVVVGFQGGRMIWQNAPQSETSVYTTLRSPLFMTEKVDYVAWQKLNR